ncbi:MAG TPA: hypothetical protein PLI47_13225 [Bacteroidia bacterium]|jgi:hypothetical protein|nr:hypothetical protein [Bacteroidota bacterium]MBK7570708.1 hypothetical protein [Bacteroidota bacterium]MBP9789630.1 hypothetical protein [Bacteroidia bacterium]HQV99351.1 hypothetical protein [Bacteroidia bacterium]HQW24261.1 hypothetical protein [Bacteroidia bacterium]
MKYFLIFLVLFTQALATYSQELSRLEMRNKFQGCTSKENTETLYLQLSAQKNVDQIHSGYYGAVVALRAKYNSNPIKKYNYCKEGLILLSSAIDKAPHDIELRYLRLIIQTNIPSFLGMNTNVEEDKNTILGRIESEKDLPLKTLVSQFLLKSDICTETEKKKLASI